MVSDDEIDGDDELNVIVATKVLENKAKEAGTHTVLPLLDGSSLEETKEETKEADLKPRLLK